MTALRQRGGRPWVVIGRLAVDPGDEVWTRSKRLIRAIRKRLDPDEGWRDGYDSAGGLRYEKPFVAKNIAERELNEVVRNLPDEFPPIHFTLHNNRAAWENGLITERIFDLLVEEGVLRNPTVRSFRPVARTTLVGKAEVHGKPVIRSRVWEVCAKEADLWMATRLLLLDE